MGEEERREAPTARASQHRAWSGWLASSTAAPNDRANILALGGWSCLVVHRPPRHQLPPTCGLSQPSLHLPSLVQYTRTEQYDRRVAHPQPRLHRQGTGDRILAPKMHLRRERAGGVPEELGRGERSRMGDAFQPPSPAPFVGVTEAQTVRNANRITSSKTSGE